MKKRIITLVLSIMLALSVATGATFALFSTETEVNVAITSGKVQMFATADNFATASAEWDNDQGKYIDKPNSGLNFALGGMVDVAEGKQSIEIENMVPGDSVTFTITIKNDSSVAILYKVDISSNDSSSVLFDALEITIGTDTFSGADINSAWTTWLTSEATTKTIDVTIKLPMEAGNEYQEKTANIKYYVYGVQANANANANV